MSDKIVQFNEGAIKNELKDLVRNSVEDCWDNGCAESFFQNLKRGIG